MKDKANLFDLSGLKMKQKEFHIIFVFFYYLQNLIEIFEPNKKK